MVRSFRHRGLGRFFRSENHQDRRGIPAASGDRIKRLLDRLDASARPEDMNLPGYRFHPLKGNRKETFAVAVSGNLRITFRFDREDAVDVDLEDYH